MRKLTVMRAPLTQQENLFEMMPDKPLTGEGESRTRSGQAVEEAMAELFPEMTPIPSSGLYDAVYDFEWRKTLIECKSVHFRSSIPLYLSRTEKDAQVEDQGHEVIYMIVTHNCPKSNTLSELWHNLSRHVRSVYLVPSSEIRRMIYGAKVRHIKTEVKGSRMGYEREGYCRGYQLLNMREVRNMKKAPPYLLRAKKYGLDLMVRVWRHESLKRRFVHRTK